MKAISVRAPWWWFILHAGKDIENRDWPTRFRGTVLLHASRWWRLDEVQEDSADAIECYNAAKRLIANKEFTYRELRDIGGHIVGKVDIVDCVSSSDSPWFFGKYGFVLANPVAFERPIPCKGALGLFDIPSDILNIVERAA